MLTKPIQVSRSQGAKETPPTAERSRIMRAVKGRGNLSTEVRMVEILRENKITGWRRHQPLPGRPDFVFRAQRVALFVDGCFWHGCKKCFRAPKDRAIYWSQKIEGNRRRDRRVSAQLRAAGWHVMRVWEHDMKRERVIVSRLCRMLGMAPLKRGQQITNENDNNGNKRCCALQAPGCTSGSDRGKGC
jgi:DNA mismatch endonuclease (patch repair protein)